MRRTGGCQCGAVRYECAGEPLALYACHCTECRKQSASAFGMSFIVLRESFRITRGAPKRWIRRADSGRHVHCFFCPTCGSRLWHEREGVADSLSVKAGSLDEPVDFSAAVHIWTSRKMPGFNIPEEAVQFPGEPD
ncbi:GFA family protein [Aestuariivirga sp. YIM B02566]|uniref:GFA family protein n=1 Tax=Taklimakanibacter albus TaxID=2800327 RepID=A0ACC5QZM1_9HYPH|nr:GFA family protein [Aestuariivirga sp. YIM B02566]MBK1865643.1 GFA family protein [Aestuariivirga sp. YIM B02566]